MESVKAVCMDVLTAQMHTHVNSVLLGSFIKANADKIVHMI